MHPLDCSFHTNAILETDGKTAAVSPTYVNGRNGLNGMLPMTRRRGSVVLGTDNDCLYVHVVLCGQDRMMGRCSRQLQASSELPSPVNLAGQPGWGSEWDSNKRGEDGFLKMDALPAAAPSDQEMRLSS